MKQLIPDITLSLRLATRARLFPFTTWLLLALSAIVLMAAQFSGRQPATIALDVGLSVIRLAMPLLIVFLAQELFTREFERRYFLNSFAYPRPRSHFLLGRVSAILIVSLGVLAVLGLALAGLTWFAGQSYQQATPVSLGGPYVLTLLFIYVDLIVVTAIATLLSVVAISPSFVLVGTIGFMLIARSYSSIISLLHQDAQLVGNAALYQDSLAKLGFLLPDLGALDIRMISLYSSMKFLPGDWGSIVLSCIAYSVALIAITIVLLKRKRLS